MQVLAESLWRSSLPGSLPKRSLKLATDQFVSVELLEALQQCAGTLSMTMEIAPELSKVLKDFAAARKAIVRVPTIIRDGGDLLMPESHLKVFIQQVEDLKKEVEVGLSQFDPTAVIALRDDMQQRVQDTILVSLQSRSSNLTMVEMTQAAENAALLFVNQSFPDPSHFTSFEFDYTTPVPALQALPPVDEETLKKLRGRQREEVKHVWSLLLSRYISIEESLASGHLHETEEGLSFVFVDASIPDRLKRKLEIISQNRVEIKAGGEGLEIPDKDLPVVFSGRVGRLALAETKNLSSVIGGMRASLDDIASADPVMAAQYAQIMENLDVIPTLIEGWKLTNSKRKGKRLAAILDAIYTEDDDDYQKVSIPVVAPTAVTNIDVGYDDDDDDDIIVSSAVAVLEVQINADEDDDSSYADATPEETVASLAAEPSGTLSKQGQRRPVARRKTV